MSSACGYEKTACFLSASVANRKSPSCLLKCTAYSTCDRSWCHSWEVMDCLSHSSDLTPNDYHLFRPREKHLAVKTTCNRHRREASSHLLDTVAWSNFFYFGKQTFKPQRSKCLSVNGGYVENWYVLSATQCLQAICHIIISAWRCMFSYVLRTLTIETNQWEQSEELRDAVIM